MSQKGEHKTTPEVINIDTTPPRKIIKNKSKKKIKKEKVKIEEEQEKSLEPEESYEDYEKRVTKQLEQKRR